MTVAELKKELDNFDDDLNVMIRCNYSHEACIINDVDEVYIDETHVDEKSVIISDEF